MSLSRKQIFDTQNYQEMMGDSTYLELIQKLRERNFSNKDLGITYRELNNWSSKELLFEKGEFGKWKKFSMVDLIWINIIKELRLYSLSLESIKTVKDHFLYDLDVDYIIENDNDDQIHEVMLEVLKNASSEEMYNTILESQFYHDFIHNKGYIKYIKELMESTVFEMCLMEAYFLKYKYHIVINPSGDTMFIKDIYTEEITSLASFQQYFATSHITISLNATLSKVFEHYSPKELAYNWKLINKDEEKILNIINESTSIKSINIKFNEKSKLESFEFVEDLQMSKAEFLKKIIIEGGYHTIKIITQKGKVVHCERTTKKKI